MVTSASPAASSLITAPALPGAGAASTPARFGGAPDTSFASLLGQLGQPLAATAATATPLATAPATDGTNTSPAVFDPLSPAASLLTPATSPAAPSQTAVPLPDPALAGGVGAKPSGATGETSEKTAGKKVKPGANDPNLSISLPEPPAPVATPAQPMLPAASPPLNSPLNLAIPTSTAANPVVAGSDDPPSTAVSPPTPAPIQASPAVTPAPLKESVTAAAPSAPAASPVSSRLADQAAAATQAGLSVNDDRETDDEPSESQIVPRQASATANHIDQNPSAIPLPAISPQLASAAVPPAAVAPPAPLRGGATMAVRTSEDAPAPSSAPAALTANPAQAAQAPTADIPAPAAAQSPTNVLIAAAPTASTRPAQAASPPPSPATQVAQAIAEPVKVVLTSPAQAGPTTPHVTTIQITPVELGRVEVRIERTSDGPAKIQLIAERPETLSRLVHDQSQLQQALDHVGIPQNSRTIEFSLASATTDGTAFSSSLPGNNASGGEFSGNGSQRQNSAYYNPAFSEPDDTQLAPTTQSRTLRAGIDITA